MFNMYNFSKEKQSGNTKRYVYSSPDTKYILVLEGHWHVQDKTELLSKLHQLPRSLCVQKSIAVEVQQ